MAMKEQARFFVESLDAQARPSGRRLYSQVASNTTEACMKSMETAIYDVRQLLERFMKPHRKWDVVGIGRWLVCVLVFSF